MKILVDVPGEASALAALQKSGAFEIDVIAPPAETARPLDAAKIADTEVLFCTCPPKNFADLRSLKWVQIASTGYTQLLGLDLPGRGIRATNCRGCFDVPIAEWNLSMMVNLKRDLRQMIRNQDAALWDRSAVFQQEIRGLTVGMWGYGGIGRETARIARLMGLRVYVLTRTGTVGKRKDVYTVPGTGDPDGILPDRVFGPSETIDFLSALDFLIVALPLSPATEGLIGERELRALPRTAFLLNPSRGPIVHEKALLRALEEKWIAGAALDTHYQYPLPASHPLWRFSNVVLTPHISGSSLSPRFKERLWDIFMQNVARFTRNDALLNLLTAEQLNGQ